MRLALYTFGVFAARSQDPANAGFHARNDINLRNVDVSDGFVARSGYDNEPGPASWGTQVYPRFYVEKGDGWSPSTLSLWEDLASPMAYTYSGVHAEAMRHGREWFLKPQWPPLVLWWVADDHVPTWAEGVQRHEHLHDFGPTPTAFHFKIAFGADGQSIAVDRDAMKRKIEVNSLRHETFV